MSSPKPHTVLYNFSSLGLLQVANFLLSLVVIPYVLRVVGADGFGVIAVAQVLIFYLSVTADYGFSRTAIRDVALYREDKQRISKVFFTVLASKLLICILAFLLLLLLVMIVPLFRNNSAVYLLGFSFVIGQAVLVNWFFQGLEKMHYMAIASLISRLLFVLLVFFFLKEKQQLSFYIFFMGLGNVVVGLISIFIIIKKYQLEFIRPRWTDIVYEFKTGWPVTITNLSQITIQYIGVFILRLFTNDVVVGYYSIAERVYFAMKLMLDVFSQVAYPRVCILLQQGTGSVKNFFRTIYLPLLAVVIAGAGLIAVFALLVIHFFTGDHHDNAALLLRILCAAVVIVCLQIPASLVLLAGDHRRHYLRVYTAGTFVNIATNLSLAPLWQASGTVLSVIITELFIMGYLYMEVFRLYRNQPGIGQEAAKPVINDQ
ncbi:MAG TPA: oligosaccharide flippase family protein [Chitinophagaceae bacterium]